LAQAKQEDLILTDNDLTLRGVPQEPTKPNFFLFDFIPDPHRVLQVKLHQIIPIVHGKYQRLLIMLRLHNQEINDGPFMRNLRDNFLFLDIIKSHNEITFERNHKIRSAKAPSQFHDMPERAEFIEQFTPAVTPIVKIYFIDQNKPVNATRDQLMVIP
jgi:hypothetical protein